MFAKLPKRLKLSLLFSALITFALILVNLGSENPKPYQFFTGANNIEEEKEPKQNPQIERIFKADIPKLQGEWAVVAKDLKTGKSYEYNLDEVFSSASLYKLAVMWAIFDAVENGKLQKDETLASQLETMITVSDNDSALALAERLGWTNITKLMQKEGLGGFNLSQENPTITARSAVDLLSRIYAKTAVSQSSSQSMQELLFAQQINDRIPKYLPKETKVAHKTGEIDNFRHDAGIILGQRSHYIFVFLTESSNPTETSENIAKLSQKIYEALEAR